MKIINNKLSVIIPSRSDWYTQKTVTDLLNKAKGDIEIIVVLDGQWPKKMIEDDQRVKIIFHGGQHKNYGLKESVNLGVAASCGEYIMKTDEHCAFDEGFDLKLKADCEYNWLVTPRRLKLDAVKWELIDKESIPIDNMHFKFPTISSVVWKKRSIEYKNILIGSTQTIQGSCYFTSREHWDWMGGLDSKAWGPFYYESEELCLKTWLGGGRVVTNKNTWYAHHRRSKGEGRGYGFCNKQTRLLAETKSKAFADFHNFWLNNRWPKQIHDFKWLIEKFMPIPGWPDNWREKIYEK